MISASRRRKYAIWLFILLVLFCFRVAGQMLVAFAGVGFLPPMKEWYSGLLAYRYLLPAQFLIIFLFGKICIDLFRGTGYFAIPRERMGRTLRIFGIVYLLSMIVRYVLLMSLYPGERWFGGSIPIFFHWVLAIYVLVLASFNRSENAGSRENTEVKEPYRPSR
jgi:hypothetical protein